MHVPGINPPWKRRLILAGVLLLSIPGTPIVAAWFGLVTAAKFCVATVAAVPAFTVRSWKGDR